MEPRSLRFPSHDLSNQRKQELQQTPLFPFHEFSPLPQQLSSFPEASGMLRLRDVGISDTLFCGSSVMPSEMVGFSPGCNNLSSSSPAKHNAVHRSAFPNFLSYESFDSSDGSWRGHGSQPPPNWMANYAAGSFLGGSLEKPLFLGEALSNAARYHDQRQISSSSPDSISDIKEQQSTRVDLYRNEFDGISPAVDGGCDFHLVPSSFPGLDLQALGHASRIVPRNMDNEDNAHGLSLSLSSNPSRMVETPYDSEFVLSKGNKGGISKGSIISRSERSSFHGVVPPSTYVARSCGPLGPFTGYETILRSSIYMKPAKQLLDEICGFRLLQDGMEIETLDEAFRISSSSLLEGGLSAIVEEAEAKRNCGSTNFSPSSRDDYGSGSSSAWPRCLRSKAKLTCLHNEVCRMHKQYHHQIQVATSSFEGVAGLGGAAPFVPVALKRVSRGFRCLKHAISDKLNHIVGEALPTTGGGVSGSEIVGSSSSLRYEDHLSDKPKPVGANMGYFGLPQQNVWRPQRGLPERAVAILRAWLFEHFLHPYPTDNDKHMLASQTGLSRNQVSNWFINARVRVWKPMVEEIHLLETKGKTESKQALKHEGNKFEESSMLNKLLDHPSLRYPDEAMERWPEGRKTKMNVHPPPANDGSAIIFHPSPANGLDGGGHGSVSLTLGLKRGVDYVQHQQQIQGREEQLIRRQMEREMVHHVTIAEL